jgi:hypothetical protein
MRFDITVVRQVVRLHAKAQAQGAEYHGKSMTGAGLGQPDNLVTR